MPELIVGTMNRDLRKHLPGLAPAIARRGSPVASRTTGVGRQSSDRGHRGEIFKPFDRRPQRIGVEIRGAVAVAARYRSKRDQVWARTSSADGPSHSHAANS